MSQITDCNCALNPFWIDYCPVHNPNAIDRTTMGDAMFDSPSGYTFTPPHAPYPLSPFPLQETIHSRFFFAQDPSPDLHALAPHLGYHAVHHASDASSQQSLPFEVTSTATLPATGSLTSIGALPTDGWAESPHHLSHFATSFTTTPLDPYSDHVTAVNATETYGVPVGVMDQSTTISSISNPVVIEQKRWYTEYNVDRDANGLFHCPFAECSKQNKRRDQLWEHWKGKHNNDPYRCSFCRKTWIYNGEKAHSCNTEMTICQICQKQVTRHHLTDHQKTRGCNSRRRNEGISSTVIDYGGSL